MYHVYMYNVQFLQGGRRASRTAPIVIRQALHSGEDGIKIWGTEIQIVCIVARVRNIRMQSTKITYTIQDMTGRMTAVLWLDQEAMDEDVSLNTSVDTSFCPANLVDRMSMKFETQIIASKFSYIKQN